ncbi:uncharacterized protein involved in copper resistance [Sphaerochaeta pleomorpha str. Grapes]|uniref:PF03932 family protein CutC n=1 Tax=Sphaerochaeta pleomorpha (strain ATCC BAA-1885 / DSM 22778 / Grapes) TaxID=158190 RepID=G8QVY9_SPHPG|nr:copper homeostasis protein CutC [Sphaerochaeta pleomorpha]AEV30513.1 uncharacterized protein involved in copper resistance [Sphaerochaeta pleomorpha str. Grapes]
MSKIQIEICLEDVQSVINAEKGGADRVELCSDLFEGGLTPTLGTFLVAQQNSKIPMQVMIRPRGGDFCYSDIEFSVMLKDIDIFKSHGATGIVFGILKADGEIDMERSREVVERAKPLSITFHRAFDMTKDGSSSLEKLIELGIDRVLTSGLEPTVPEGVDMLSLLVEQAGNRIIVMPGCGLHERNFTKMHQKIGAKEYHLMLPEYQNSLMQHRSDDILMGGVLRQSEYLIAHTGLDRVKGVCKMV